MASLDALLVPRTRDEIMAILLSYLQGVGFPVTDYNAGGVALEIMHMIATGLLDRESLVSYIVAGGFLDLAAALVDASGAPVESWAEMLAEETYNLLRDSSSFTQKNLTLTCATGSGPVTRAAGQVRAISQVGHYYVNTASVTVPDGGSVSALFQAENPGPVTDATGTIDSLSTPISGVTVVDGLAAYGLPVKNISGSGTVTPSSGQATNPVSRWTIQIVQSGSIGDAVPPRMVVTEYPPSGIQVVGAPTNVVTTLSLAGIDATIDLTLTFANGASGVAFLAGDSYSIGTPGTATVQIGSEQESLVSLVQRCHDRWPSLSAIPTEGRYAAWARQCSLENHLGINRIATSASEDVAGQVDVYLADYGGAPGTSSITLVQTYFDLRQTDIERAVAQTAAVLTIVPSGDIWVKQGYLAVVQNAAVAAWNAYLAAIPIGGEMPNHCIRCSKLEQIIMDAGAFDADGLQLNSHGVGADILNIGANYVPASSALGLLDPACVNWFEVA